jgi:prevent-host-death family protein
MVAVKISDFKAHLAKYLRQVKTGQEMEILDRGAPVARVTPITSETTVTIQAAVKKPEGLSQLRSQVSSFAGDAVQTLIEERQER